MVLGRKRMALEWEAFSIDFIFPEHPLDHLLCYARNSGFQHNVCHGFYVILMLTHVMSCHLYACLCLCLCPMCYAHVYATFLFSHLHLYNFLLDNPACFFIVCMRCYSMVSQH
ncbi:hypothetical protein BJX70DRAFT_73441 [Aspergillus crustosus]